MTGRARLDGRVAIITGAAAGIGQAAAAALAREGADVVLADVADCGDTARMVSDAGRRSLAVKCDVSDRHQVEALVARTVAEFGRLDCAFNNAGTAGVADQPVHEADEDDWDQVLAVNLKGVWLCMKYQLRHMLQQGHGVIVNGASATSFVGIDTNGAYVASKHAIMGITRTAALEYASHGIRINAVCPGVVRTAMTQRFLNPPVDESVYARLVPLGRMADPAEVAGAVVWLCSDESSYVTGSGVLIDGGMLAR